MQNGRVFLHSGRVNSMFHQLRGITQRFDFLVVAKVCQNSDDHCLILYFDRARQCVLDTGIHMSSKKRESTPYKKLGKKGPPRPELLENAVKTASAASFFMSAIKASPQHCEEVRDAMPPAQCQPSILHKRFYVPSRNGTKEKV